MLKFVLHFCCNLQTQLVRGLRSRHIEIELENHPNKVQVGISTALPTGFTMHNIFSLLVEKDCRGTLNHDLRSYPMVCLDEVESTTFTMMLTCAVTQQASRVKLSISFGEVTIEGQVEIANLPVPTDSTILTFVFFTSLKDAEQVGAILQTVNRWSPQVSTSLSTQGSEELLTCFDATHLDVVGVEDLSSVVPSSQLFFDLEPQAYVAN